MKLGTPTAPRSSAPRRARIPWLAGLALVVSLAASCTSVGGKKVRVELATAPEVEADAYVVPQDRWFAGGKDLYRAYAISGATAKDQARAALLAWLDAWRVRAKRTPVEVVIVACQHVFVAAHEGELDYVEFDPLELRADETGLRKLSLEVARHGAVAGTR